MEKSRLGRRLLRSSRFREKGNCITDDTDGNDSDAGDSDTTRSKTNDSVDTNTDTIENDTGDDNSVDSNSSDSTNMNNTGDSDNGNDDGGSFERDGEDTNNSQPSQQILEIADSEDEADINNFNGAHSAHTDVGMAYFETCKLNKISTLEKRQLDFVEGSASQLTKKQKQNSIKSIAIILKLDLDNAERSEMDEILEKCLRILNENQFYEVWDLEERWNYAAIKLRSTNLGKEDGFFEIHQALLDCGFFADEDNNTKGSDYPEVRTYRLLPTKLDAQV